MNDIKAVIGKINAIGVFCGASKIVSQEYMDLAFQCGEMLAQEGIELVYGGGAYGLMGEVYRGVNTHGGKIFGVYTQMLNEVEPLNDNITNCTIVDTLYQRKELMISRSDAFFILPGGFGTLDEFFEIIVLKFMRQHDKKLILVNYKGFWNKLIDLCEELKEKKFVKCSTELLYSTVSTLEEAFQLIKA
ncbi:TIGR00730 family Rossman fold protein [Rickettsiales endosymbiont of Peranema trichophorum]|uniref:LOG family protein n=1 Tax=Rickettsiales endosymbiont of Peranema trichophorum TaxID=2486577 RepID=UPI001023DE05|nr:TIGR00730 family Rossman fold protein [Rickettsiales endosymbiont of Peranema trichophorum]RZI46348.1 TIGR00730 family Rossman fold protein [Rickettsiales endosymbiont of Peranema trichophorum]